jgi:positive regulator of sigma E activity
MVKEELVEEGIVIKKENGFAEISLSNSDNCHDCSAKLLCNPSKDNKNRTVRVEDPYGVNEGDIVRISITGGTVLKATFLLYGFPWLLLILGILSGYFLFEGTALHELYSFLTGAVLMGAYYGFLKMQNPRKSYFSIPKIIFVKRTPNINLNL